MNTLVKSALAIAMAVSLSACGPEQTSSNTASTVAEVSATPTAAESTQEKIFNLPYTMEELDNGLRVVVVKTDYPDLVSMHIPVQTGSRNEVEAGKSGFAHFFEHMMFKGTPSYSAAEYGQILKSAGVDGNAYTSDDLTNYYNSFPASHLETMLKVEADRFQNLTYTESVFRTEALAVKGEYLKNYSNPIRKLFSHQRNIAYDVHPYKHTTMGFPEDIDVMPDQMEYAQKFFKRWYSPQFTTIIVVGDIDPDQTMKWVKQYWGTWPRVDNNFDIPKEPAPTVAKYDHFQVADLPQSYISFGFHSPAMDEDSKEKPALDLAGEVYFSETSDVYQELVIQKQYVDQFFYYSPDRKDSTLTYIIARLKDEKFAPQVRQAIADTLVRARTELVDEDKLANIKSNSKYSFAQSMDSSGAIAGMLSSTGHFKRSPETVNNMYATIDKVTSDDVLKSANAFFTDERRVLVTMSASDSMAGFEQDLNLGEMVAAKQADADKAANVKFVDLRNQSNIIDVSLLFNTGAAEDPEGKKGLATLTAMLLTEGGSAAKTYQDIQADMYPIAGSWGFQVDKEMLLFSGRIHKDNLDAWYALVSDQFLNPGWREDDFGRIKDKLKSAIDSDLKASNDEELGKEVLYSALYQGHPYGSFNYGALSDIDSLTIDDVKGFYADMLTQKRLTIGVTGNMDDAFVTKMNKDLAKLNAGDSDAPMIDAAPVLTGRQAIIVAKPSTQSTAVSFGFPIDVNRSDKEWLALWLARSWLGEHRNSNSYLYQRIRSVRGMNYGDYAYIEYYPRGMFQQKPDANLGRQQQIFQVWLRPLRSNNDAHFATRVAMFELEKLIADGMSKEDFDATSSFLENYVAQLVSNQSRILGYKLDSEYYQIPDFVDYVRDGLATMTVDDVNAAIRKHLQLENIQFVFISPDAEDMKSRLTDALTSPMTYNSEKPEELYAEDKVIESYPLAIPAASISTVPLEDVFK